MRIAPPTLATAALLALCACDRPKVRMPPPPPPGEAAQRPPMPPPPQWSRALIGRPLAELFPGQDHPGVCVGNADNVEQRYGGDAPGVKIVGWGWDPAAREPIGRILLADITGLVAGAGEAGLARPDVNRARPEITAPDTGWAAYTSRTIGPVNVFGVIDGGKGLCRLGQVEF